MSKHSCPAALITCMDWRMHPAAERYIGQETFDRIIVPGGVKALIDDENPRVRDFLLKSIDISVTLHGIEAIHLVNHTDCGAYGGREAFSNCETERERHIADLREAARRVTERHPKLHVFLWLAILEPRSLGWDVRFEQVVRVNN